ncbi:DUF72 domain-containing protein [Sphingomonas sp. RHCKR47]|uniref:DUF72 domain-containing protein n=1 Tax=Sphingomonas citricola TaxID=2862498 RepID=UPI001C673D87|nr:DUF72 domain-containing protein [Sphingomonas citricola]MBW6524155.1 DUF72 domain-containing protein [Sphingomonas citricola]
MTNPIRVGIGGWTFEPWRGAFYPPKWPIKRELEFASRHVSAIEVNGTLYSSFKPATFAAWRDASPDGFVFALKASRYCVTRKVLAEAGESIARFVGQGIVELGDKLGPILWQFASTRHFDADDFAAFLSLLPHEHAGVRLRHVVHVRHESFLTPVFVDLCRAAGVAIVNADSADYPAIGDVSGDLAYVRLEDAREEEPTGYAPAVLDDWAERARALAAGDTPTVLLCAADPAPVRPRETFVFMINGAKVRAPHAAMALIERLGGLPG